MFIKIIKYFTFTILGIIIFFLVTNLIIITSTKNLIASAKQRHLESLKAKEEKND